MIDLSVLKLLDILPIPITDEEMEALSYALDPELKEITAAINEAVIMTRIDELPENLVDLLAWQLHVDFYEPLGLDLDRKRALVKNSLIWHRYKGTKYALESMIRILFFDNFKIEEWFEYGGEPYFFRVTSQDLISNRGQYKDLIRAIYELKNTRSWLERLRFEREIETTIYFGYAGRHKRKYTIDGISPKIEIAPANLYIGIVGKYVRRFTVPAADIDPEIEAALIALGKEC